MIIKHIDFIIKPMWIILFLKLHCLHKILEYIVYNKSSVISNFFCIPFKTIFLNKMIFCTCNLSTEYSSKVELPYLTKGYSKITKTIISTPSCEMDCKDRKKCFVQDRRILKIFSVLPPIPKNDAYECWAASY